MKPTVVCLSGSTRFYEVWQKIFYEEEMKGNIVLTISFHPDVQSHNGMTGITSEQKTMLDELHLQKIKLADELLVLNVGGYIGESTQREIDYALSLNKPVRFLEAYLVEGLFQSPEARDHNMRMIAKNLKP